MVTDGDVDVDGDAFPLPGGAAKQAVAQLHGLHGRNEQQQR